MEILQCSGNTEITSSSSLGVRTNRTGLTMEIDRGSSCRREGQQQGEKMDGRTGRLVGRDDTMTAHSTHVGEEDGLAPSFDDLSGGGGCCLCSTCTERRGRAGDGVRNLQHRSSAHAGCHHGEREMQGRPGLKGELGRQWRWWPETSPENKKQRGISRTMSY